MRDEGKGRNQVKWRAIPVDVIAVFYNGRYPEPLRVRFIDERGEQRSFRIDYIGAVRADHAYGQKTFIYRCQTTIDNWVRPFELRYFLNDMRWELLKL